MYGRTTMKYIQICTTLLIMILLTGCIYGNDYVDDKQELVVFSGRNFSDYKYSEKVVLHIHYGAKNKDYIGVATTNYAVDDDWVDSSNHVLSGTIDRFAWDNYTLFVCESNKYYVFDIKSYQYTSNVDSSILKKYNQKEFDDSFPENSKFEWCNAHE